MIENQFIVLDVNKDIVSAIKNMYEPKFRLLYPTINSFDINNMSIWCALIHNSYYEKEEDILTCSNNINLSNLLTATHYTLGVNSEEQIEAQFALIYAIVDQVNIEVLEYCKTKVFELLKNNTDDDTEIEAGLYALCFMKNSNKEKKDAPVQN